MRSSRITVIDIGASHVACGVFSAAAGGRLALEDFVFRPLLMSSASETAWMACVAPALASVAALQVAGPCSLAVPGHLVLTKFLRTPAVAPAQRGQVIAFAAAEEIPIPLGEVVWDYAVVADDGSDLEVMLAAARIGAMQQLCGAIEEAGFAVERATPGTLALWHAFRHLRADDDGCVLLVEVGASSTQLLFVEGVRIHGRTVPLGGNLVTQAIATELKFEFTAAEELKVRVSACVAGVPGMAPAAPAVGRAWSAFAARLGLEITRTSLARRRQSGGAAPVVVYLSGGGSLGADLPAALAARLKVRVERFDPLRHVDVSAAARTAGGALAGPTLANLVGLATRLVAAPPCDADLLPPARRQVATRRRRQPWLAGAAAGAILAMLPPLLYFHGLVASREAEMAEIGGQLMPLQARHARNEEKLRQGAELKDQIRALGPPLAARSHWLEFLADLQERLVDVEDLWLERMMREKERVTGGARPESGYGGPGTGDTGSSWTPGTLHLAPEPPPPERLRFTGRLLDVENPQAKVSGRSMQRVKELCASLGGSPFIAAVEDEAFDASQHGILRFEVTLVLAARKAW